MSTTESSAVGTSYGASLFGLVMDYARAKYIDVETPQSDANIADNVDVANNNVAGATSDSLGGLSSAMVGLLWPKVVIVTGAVLGGIFLLKKLKVI